MTNNQNKTINQDKQMLSKNDKKLLKSNFDRFMQITDYDFNQIVIKKNVGDEARTFNIVNQSKPLLSPSRIMKVFNEHLYWNIPNKILLLPRLMGQLIHKFIELRLMTGTIVKLTEDNLIDYVGNDYSTIKDNWSDEKIKQFIEDVNEGTSNIYNYLNQKKIKVLQCEKYVANYDYHGYIDMVAYKYYYNVDNTGPRIPMIIDLKITSNKEIINSYYAQLAIYRKIYENTAQCYILFYNRDTKEPRLEKASWSKLDETFESIDKLNQLFRGGK